jgi:hypothetical protein
LNPNFAGAYCGHGNVLADAPLSSGLEIVRKTLGQDEIATVQSQRSAAAGVGDTGRHECTRAVGRIARKPFGLDLEALLGASESERLSSCIKIP